LPAAARVMYRRGVGRLLVVDDDSRLRGIVTRSDLLKVHARLDAVLRDEVMRQVVGRTPQIRPGTVQATVDDGVVTLTGRTTRKTTAVAVARLTATVPGVTDVVDLLRFDVDDTVTAAHQATERRPFRGLRHARPPARPAHAQPANRRLTTTRGVTGTDPGESVGLGPHIGPLPTVGKQRRDTSPLPTVGDRHSHGDN